MIIDSNYYQIDCFDISFPEFIKALGILSPNGFLILNYAGNKHEYTIDKHIIKLNKENTAYSNEHTIVIQYSQDVASKLFTKNIFFDNKLLYLDSKENCILEWIKAGKNSSISISRKYVPDKSLQDFCKDLYINNYCVNSFTA